MPDSAPFRAWDEYSKYSPDEMRARSNDFYKLVKKRRSIRSFSSEKVPLEVLDTCIKVLERLRTGRINNPGTL